MRIVCMPITRPELIISGCDAKLITIRERAQRPTALISRVDLGRRRAPIHAATPPCTTRSEPAFQPGPSQLRCARRLRQTLRRRPSRRVPQPALLQPSLVPKTNTTSHPQAFAGSAGWQPTAASTSSRPQAHPACAVPPAAGRRIGQHAQCQVHGCPHPAGQLQIAPRRRHKQRRRRPHRYMPGTRLAIL